MAKRASLIFLIVAVLRWEPLHAQTDLNKKPIKPGETSSVTLKVEGTTKPVRVRVINKTPDVVSVKGGNDQVVMSSGGEKNIVKLEITGLKPGAPSFSMELDHTDLDTIFRQVLRKVIDDTRRRVAALESIHIPSGAQIYKLNEVAGVLQQISLDVNAALPDREFAPFRDAIDDYVASLEQRAAEHAVVISPSNMTARDTPAIVAVSYRTIASTRGVDKEAADSIFAEVIRLLDGTAERGRMRELCVHT